MYITPPIPWVVFGKGEMVGKRNGGKSNDERLFMDYGWRCGYGIPAFSTADMVADRYLG